MSHKVEEIETPEFMDADDVCYVYSLILVILF